MRRDGAFEPSLVHLDMETVEGRVNLGQKTKGEE